MPQSPTLVQPKRRQLVGTALGMAALALLGARESTAANPRAAGAGPTAERERSWFTDTPLLDQHGRETRFYSDALQGHTVLVNFMFTGCSDACPLVTHRLKKVAEALGDKFGRQVQFVSITVDPLGDGPTQLRDYAARFDLPREGWRFLTGKPEAVETVLKRLGQRVGEPQVHTTMLLAGNVDGRHWRKLQAEQNPRVIARTLEELLAAPQTGSR